MILKKLRDIGITVLYVDYPDLGDLDRHLEPYLTPARREIYAQVREAFTTMEAGGPAERQLRRVLRDDAATHHGADAPGQAPDLPRRDDGGLGSDAVRHAAAVAHLAMVMGLRLEQYIIKQRRLPRTTRARW
jgi:hypothetical protein